MLSMVYVTPLSIICLTYLSNTSISMFNLGSCSAHLQSNIWEHQGCVCFHLWDCGAAGGAAVDITILADNIAGI